MKFIQVIRLFMILIVLILSSCKSKDESRTSIYFFKVESLSTIMPINCEEILNKTGLYKLNLNKRLTEKIVSAIENDSNNTSYNPDIRYRINLTGNTSVCLDYFGNFVTSSGNKGQTELINEINTFIDNHIKDAIIVTVDFEEPWNN